MTPRDPDPCLDVAALDRPAIPDVLAEHLEEVAYLAIQRRKLLFSPDIPLRRLRLHDERIEAHLDGLRVGGEASVRMVEAKLEGDDPWFVYAAARVWLALGQPAPETVAEKLKNVPPEFIPSWREAFRHLSPEQTAQLLPETDAETWASACLEIAVDAWGWHGLLTRATSSKLTAAPSLPVRRALARHTSHAEELHRFVEDEDGLVRRHALWNLGLHDPSATAGRCRQAAQTAQPDPFELRVLGLLGDQTDGVILADMFPHEDVLVASAALWGLRDLGYSRFAERVVNCMDSEVEDVAAVAGVVMESLVGCLPDAPSKAPVPDTMGPAQFHWRQVREGLDLDGRRLNGQPFPWTGEPADEPMEWVWRKALLSPQQDTAWLRREVPDGLFTGLPSLEATPGE